MIKALFQALVFLAVVHFLAVMGGLGWLLMTERLDESRTMELVDLLSETVSEEEARLDREAKDRDAAIAAEEAGRLPSMGISAGELSDVRVELTQVDRARLERMQREVEDLQASLRRERLMLDSERGAFEEDRDAFHELRKEFEESHKDVQFKKAINTISKMDPGDAMLALSALIEDGKQDQVVAYLSSMSDRIRTDVLSEFVGDDQADLAAELLEAVRTRSNAAALADASGP